MTMAVRRHAVARASLSLLAAGGFLLLASVAPWMPAHGSRRPLPTAAARAGSIAHASGQPPAITAPSGGFTLHVPPAGPLRPRAAPVPGLPGSSELAHLEAGGLAIFVDRLPPSVSPGAALDELQLALLPQGWLAAGGPRQRLPEGAPPTRVFVRGAELCVATIEAAEGGTEPLLVSAYSRQSIGRQAPEIPR